MRLAYTCTFAWAWVCASSRNLESSAAAVDHLFQVGCRRVGTITGLLTTFRAMAGTGELNQAFVSRGIAEALITTLLGLIMVIPGLLLCSWIRRRYRELVKP